ncbi:uncharacterized protein BCR38DRAFT_364814 [Pseudomassariella vexata]|uniref:Zn(2)-C6 fungal-type domain-containing protein n=1 Tax=Pseudomassariella vexata TaxID=1141098 RepID=A0A1Y2E755_9PEZI|nr:uncharacterized protein BCR38DRAFT_364814 [Pseudomassariella vexata]ORY67382.1 hypothetical protein BCR38DRAFT_364814 [Pseudomassariella vexata]
MSALKEASSSRGETRKNCHNCRRRRRRCDRSVPGCHKCHSTGQECLGYGSLYRWTDSMVSRGRMNGQKTFAPTISKNGDENDHSWVIPYFERRQEMLMNTPRDELGILLMDPLLQDMDSLSRRYLSYFAERFCQDLVVNDSPQRGANPFRELIPMCGMHSFLQHIIVAASAIHFSNLMRSGSNNTYPQIATDALVDALHARHKAIKALQLVLERYKDEDRSESKYGEMDALLATIVFFINFALVDSGKGAWRSHMEAAGRLIIAQSSEYLHRSENAKDINSAEFPAMSARQQDPDGTPLLDVTGTAPELSFPLNRPIHSTWHHEVGIRDYIASDFMAYYVWNNTLDSLVSSIEGSTSCAPSIDFSAPDVLAIATRTEANSYHSCPAHLLYTILETSRLMKEISSNSSGLPTPGQMDACAAIIREAQAFDVHAWATGVCAANAESCGPVDELQLRLRTHIAATYRATTCLFVLLTAPGLQNYEHSRIRPGDSPDSTPMLPNSEDFVATILHQLSFIPASSPLFKYTTWPVFMTGVETACPERRAWVIERLRAMWDICPWGMLKSAMETLFYIWQLRDDATGENGGMTNESVGKEKTAEAGDATGTNSLMQLRGNRVDCLIV